MAGIGKERIKDAISEAAALLGYCKLTPCQVQPIEEFVSGKDVFVSLPTSAGKSLCFCLLPKVFDTLKNSESAT